MSDEITEPTVRLCWNESAIRRAAEVLRAAHLDIMAADVEAHLKPIIDEPELSFSVINARPSYTDTVTTLTKLGDRWFDLDGNHVGPFETLSDVEVLHIGVGRAPLDLESPALQDRIATACGDPGSIVGRQHHINESLSRWSMRAVLHVIAEAVR